ncbi:RagB/SusD family nutrient uptake outer membrane protein [Hymenobacter terrenus]|uniref:RagB/SusD family nutrient uptake outer membrane protein n=1 Tax=Hymenobacter terrenus TaxID=1629124 RepID=UPI000619F4D2|nr:RagB/SusD family nutrient uptake outer membrane protein [Hymenobacter terrenus]
MKTLHFRAALLLVLGLSGGLLQSCQDPLDIQPQQSVDASTALNTEAKVGSAVVGIYAKLDNPALYGTNLIMLPELIGGDDYVNWQGTFRSYQEVFRRTLISTNAEADRTWLRAYEAINQSNLVLDALDVVATPALKSQYQGEARFLRAAMYFELVRLYAKQYEAGTASTDPGVPLALTAIKNVDQAGVQVPRATVEQVYAQVITDLTTAMTLLPDASATRATKYSAEALLARVQLQKRDYAAARIAADNVIRRSGKALAATLASVFTNKNSTESLFEIQQNDQNNAGTANDGLATFFAGYSTDGGVSGTGRADVQVEGSFASRYEESDVRGTDSLTATTSKKLIYLGNYARSSRRLRSGKWLTYGQNIPVIRLAEMYLIRAEADVRAGLTTGSPLNDVNTIRQRSGATPFTSLTLDDVLNERQLEFAFEGFYIHDIRRNNLSTVIVPYQPQTADDPEVLEVLASNPRLILPIPQREINVNPTLVQNASY